MLNNFTTRVCVCQGRICRRVSAKCDRDTKDSILANGGRRGKIFYAFGVFIVEFLQWVYYNGVMKYSFCISNFSLPSVPMKLELIFGFFALLGAMDMLAGNRFRLGAAFEKGIMTTGPLILSMAGMIVLSPVLAQGISRVLGPVCAALGMDLSVLAGFFPVDAGGATMAYALSDNAPLRAYNGILVASMLGATICPVIPLALQTVPKKFHDDVLTGLLCGIATIPVGCILPGLFLGAEIGPLLLSSLPMLVISGAICFGLWKNPTLVSRLLGWVGKLLMAFVTVGILIGMLELFAGVKAFPQIALLSEAFTIIGNIAVLLAGVFPLLEILSRLLKKPIDALGRKMRISGTSVLGLVTTLANSIPVFSLLEQMDKRGRILNMAFAVSAGYAFGDHLAFVLSYDRAYALPMVAGKVIAGLAALGVALLVSQRQTAVAATPEA